MKQFFILLAPAMLLWQTQTTFAQPGHERIQSLMISFITRELDLTPEEAQVFWPVYNQYTDEMETVQEQKRKMHEQYAGRVRDLNEKEAGDVLEKLIALDQQEMNIRSKYYQEFKKVLPTRKVLLLIEAERKFRLRLLEEIKKRQDDRRDPRF